MKRLLLLALLASAVFAISVLPSAFGDATDEHKLQKIAESKQVVQTVCKLTQTLANGETGFIAAPTVRAFSGTPATIEIESADGKKLKFELTSTILADAKHLDVHPHAKPQNK